MKITLDKQDIAVHGLTESITQTALANSLDDVGLMSLNQNSQLTQEQADDFARKIDSSVLQTLRGKVLK